MEALRQYIEKAQKIVFLGGAGLSTESGIPDFRSSDGVFKAIRAYGVPPETLLSIDFFEDYPEIFFVYYKKFLIYPDAQPNKAHKALAKLEEIGKLNAVVTQNIDGLHQKAGSKTVYELHGSVLRNNCMHCGEFYDLDYILDPAHCDGMIPKCEKCGGVVKPDVVLYEEALDDFQISGAVDAIRAADVLIIGGTSLVVYPAAGFVNYFRGSKLVLINKSSTSFDGRADLVIHDAIGKVMKEAVDGL